MLVGVFLQCFTESVFIFNPLIDTRLPQGFTEDDFNKVQPKMTKFEVSRLIQAEPDQISQICYFTQGDFRGMRPHSCWEYGRDGAAAWGDYAWFSFRIMFDENNRVITTERLAIYN